MRNIISLLHELYPDEDDPRSIAELAGLPTDRIDFKGSAFHVWQNILREARKHGRLDDVIRVAAQNYYGRADELEEAKNLYLAAGADMHTVGAGDDRNRIKLRSRRPSRHLPSDFLSCFFVDIRIPDASPTPIIELIQAFGETETIRTCCIVAHYQMDIEFSLLEIEESFAFSDSIEPERYQTIWIRGDELWRSPIVGNQAESSREDWAILRQLRPTGVDLASFEDEFERLLDESDSLFIFDFSRLSIDDIKGLSDSQQEARRDSVMYGINAFIRNVASRGQRIVIGLPRLALGLSGWRDFVESVPSCFFACELFDLPASPMYSGDPCEMLPPFVAEALRPLLSPNSYSLHTRLEKEIQALAANSRIRAAGRGQQIREVLAIASRLASEGFLDPAYRLEMWYRTSQAEQNHVLAGADVIPSPDEVTKVFGELGSIHDLPRAADRAIVTGESGQGKADALRQIEANWSLPNRQQNGRRHPAWLPIYVENLHQPTSDIANYFRQQSSIPAPEGSGVNLTLQAHAQLGRIALCDNLGWLFGSSVLYLFDGFRGASDEGQIAEWIDSLLAVSYLKVGLITSYRDTSEAPFDRQWFQRAFRVAVETRLKPLDEAQAKSLCTDTTRQQLVSSLLERIDEPLNRYIRIPFLAKCICAVSDLKRLPERCSLLELLELYVLSKYESERSERVSEVVNYHLPLLARSLYYNENASIPEEAMRVGVRYHFLASGNPVKFEHPLLQDYFFAKHLCATWKEAGQRFLESLSSIPPRHWQTRYLNLLRMVMKGLSPGERSGLAEFLGREGCEQLAHLCFLELKPDEYQALSAAREISTSLVAALGQPDEEERAADTGRTLETQLKIAESLGYYDPRLPKLEDTLSGFVPVPVVEDIELLVGRYLVTNLEFFRFMNDGGYLTEQFWHPDGWEWRRKNDVRSPAYWTNLELSRPNYPVVGVSFHEALAYSRWLTEMAGEQNEERLNFSLPTEMEWSLAAGFGSLLNGLLKNRLADHVAYALGETAFESEVLDEITLECMVDLLRKGMHHPGVIGGTPVGLYPPTEHGVYDLFNCVWQWCDGWFAIHDSNIVPSSNQQHTSGPILVRGGSATSTARGIVSLIGGGLDPFSRVDNVGFRLICRQLPTEN